MTDTLAKLAELSLFECHLGFKIDFEVKTLPKEKQKYRLLADTEGRLKFSIGGDTVFDDGDILLVEFAQTLHQWITSFSNDKQSELFYESMDFEEKPVIQFCAVGNGEYEFYSPWQKKQNVRVAGAALLQASENFIQSLQGELKKKIKHVDHYYGWEFLKEYSNE